MKNTYVLILLTHALYYLTIAFMIFEHRDYKAYLRAFANQLSIAPGMLSEVFSGQKNRRHV